MLGRFINLLILYHLLLYTVTVRTLERHRCILHTHTWLVRALFHMSTSLLIHELASLHLILLSVVRITCTFLQTSLQCLKAHILVLAATLNLVNSCINTLLYLFKLAPVGIFYSTLQRFCSAHTQYVYLNLSIDFWGNLFISIVDSNF